MSEKANMAQRYEHEIPEGYEARIDGNKVIIELKESVDERIRESIVDFIWRIAIGAFNRGSMPSAVQCQEWLSYLERQKDLKYSEEQMEDIRQYAYNKGIVDTEEKQKEQQPAEWSRQSVIDALTKWLTEKIVPLHKKSLDGTITEKEEMFEAALLEMRSFVNSPDFQIGKDISIEWSEGDEKMMNEIITIMDGGKVTSGTYLSEYVTWLKSLKDRAQSASHWKPSKKQIKALGEILCSCNTPYTSQSDIDVVADLMNDLKKL